MFENYRDGEWAISSQDPLKWVRFNDYPEMEYKISDKNFGKGRVYLGDSCYICVNNYHHELYYK